MNQVRRKSSVRTLSLAIGLLVVALFGTETITADPAAAAGAPHAGEFTFQWFKKSCGYSATGGFRAAVGGKATTLAVRNASKVYYMKIDIAVEKRVLGGWRAMERRKTNSFRFKQGALPYYVRRSVGTAVGSTIANGGTLRGHVKVTLKRVRPGPDATVWIAHSYSGPFTCRTIIGGG